MSQAGHISVTSAPTVATTFTTDDSNFATPAANNLNILSADVTTDNANGITTISSGSTVTIELTNRLQGTASVTGAITGDIITFGLGAAAAVYRFDFFIAGRDTGNDQGVGYSVQGTARTDGAAATLIQTPFIDSDEDTGAPSLESADIDLVVSGNNVILQATGVAARTISYSAVGTYVMV